MTGNPVKFVYVSTGSTKPTPVDADAIYFLEEDQQIWVGDVMIADHVEPIDIASYLAPYLVKSVSITGEGPVLTDASFDSETGEITLTKGDISLSKGTSPAPYEVTLTPGDSFTVMNSTSVSGRSISDQLVTFTLPVQIDSVKLKKAQDGSNDVIIETTATDGTIHEEVSSIFGSAAFTDYEYYTISEDTPVGSEYQAVYRLKKNGVAVGDPINIPKSSIIESSSIGTVVEPDVPYPGAVVGDKYIDLVTNSGDHIYIPLSELVQTYTAGSGININNSNVISHADIGDGTSIASVLLNITDYNQSSEPLKASITPLTLNRDSMGHLTSVTTGSTPMSILSEEGVQEVVDASVPTWTVTTEG